MSYDCCGAPEWDSEGRHLGHCTECGHGSVYCGLCGKTHLIGGDALATSQADVTRLAAELAESSRALAVSQGEVERLDGELDAKHAKLVEVADKLRAVRGDLERARELLVRLYTFAQRVCDTANELDIVQPEDIEAEGGIFADVGAFLADHEERRGALPDAMALLTADDAGDACSDSTDNQPCQWSPTCWEHRRRAFLAPTASPEPDRASPEVTVKENETP